MDLGKQGHYADFSNTGDRTIKTLTIIAAAILLASCSKQGCEKHWTAPAPVLLTKTPSKIEIVIVENAFGCRTQAVRYEHLAEQSCAPNSNSR